MTDYKKLVIVSICVFLLLSTPTVLGLLIWKTEGMICGTAIGGIFVLLSEDKITDHLRGRV
jgi:hypothetical protein